MTNSSIASLKYTEIPSREEQKNVMLCLHGYGSNKEDFVRLVPYMQETLKHTTFIVPNAPFQCHDDLMSSSPLNSHMWFPLKIDETGVNIISMDSISKASDILMEFIMFVQNKYEVTTEQIVLLGFSQGAILSLHNCLYHNKTYMGVISHSGAFYSYEPFAKAKINNTQNILLLHGKIDYIVPFELFEHTVNFLEKYDVKYNFYIRDDMGHYIEEDTLDKVINFVKTNQDKNK